MKDYYKILSVKKNSSPEELKKAYRQAAFFWHPDKNKSPNANSRFIEIVEAYEILSNSDKRQLFDKLYQEYLNEEKYTFDSQEPNFESQKHNQSNEFSKFMDLVKEANKKAQEKVLKNVDNHLTNSFNFIHEYGWFLIVIWIIASIIFAIAITNK